MPRSKVNPDVKAEQNRQRSQLRRENLKKLRSQLIEALDLDEKTGKTKVLKETFCKLHEKGLIAHVENEKLIDITGKYETYEARLLAQLRSALAPECKKITTEGLLQMALDKLKATEVEQKLFVDTSGEYPVPFPFIFPLTRGSSTQNTPTNGSTNSLPLSRQNSDDSVGLFPSYNNTPNNKNPQHFTFNDDVIKVLLVNIDPKEPVSNELEESSAKRMRIDLNTEFIRR